MKLFLLFFFIQFHWGYGRRKRSVDETSYFVIETIEGDDITLPCMIRHRRKQLHVVWQYYDTFNQLFFLSTGDEENKKFLSLSNVRHNDNLNKFLTENIPQTLTIGLQQLNEDLRLQIAHRKIQKTYRLAKRKTYLPRIRENFLDYDETNTMFSTRPTTIIEDWSLKMRNVKLSDTGVYLCKLSSMQLQEKHIIILKVNPKLNCEDERHRKGMEINCRVKLDERYFDRSFSWKFHENPRRLDADSSFDKLSQTLMPIVKCSANNQTITNRQHMNMIFRMLTSNLSTQSSLNGGVHRINTEMEMTDTYEIRSTLNALSVRTATDIIDDRLIDPQSKTIIAQIKTRMNNRTKEIIIGINITNVQPTTILCEMYNQSRQFFLDHYPIDVENEDTNSIWYLYKPNQQRRFDYRRQKQERHLLHRQQRRLGTNDHFHSSSASTIVICIVLFVPSFYLLLN
ncbi:hypothetical protein SNEBB_005355 [Seison nebaliae]|nr:hypothetical protein SNEBB_005355 [Seison nebaliae]